MPRDDLDRITSGGGDELIRHARVRGRVNVAAVVTMGVVAMSSVSVMASAAAGFAPTQRLSIDVADGMAEVVAGARSGVDTSRAAARPRDGDQPTAPAVGRDGSGSALPTWNGEALPVVDVAAAPTTAGPSPTVAATADPVASTAVETTAPATGSPTTQPTATTSGPSVAPTPTPTGSPTTAAPPGGGLSDLEQQVVDLTNVERARAGCPAVTVDARLVTSADAHAVDMVANQYFDHTGPDGSTPTTRGNAAGYPGGVAENIATGFTTADAVMAAWMDSDGHRANILTCSYTVVGIGYDPGALPGYGGGTWVQTFGSL